MKTAPSCHRRVITQFLRYATVGLPSNLVLYAFYLIGTGLGAGPKATITMLYGFGLRQSKRSVKSACRRAAIGAMIGGWRSKQNKCPLPA
jgi:hypothetical protein